MYRTHTIKCKYIDHDKSDEIIEQHLSNHNIDDYRASVDISGGVMMVTYWIKLYVSDDLELIKDDFRKAGVEMF